MKRSELKQIIREVIEEGRVTTKEPEPIFRLNAKGERLFDADNMGVLGTLIGFAVVNVNEGYALDTDTGEIWDLDNVRLETPKISAVRKLPIYSFKYEEFEPGLLMFDDLKEAKLAAKGEGKDFVVFEIRRLLKPYEKTIRSFKEEGYAGSDEDLLYFIKRYIATNDFEGIKGITAEKVLSKIERYYHKVKGDGYKNKGLSYYQELVDFAEEIQPGAGIPWIQWILENIR